MNAGKRRNAAIYVRVSTDGQTVENQTRELRQIAERRGWQVVEIYSDAGISAHRPTDKERGAQLRTATIEFTWLSATAFEGVFRIGSAP